MRHALMLAAAFVVLAWPAAAAAQKVNTDFDAAANFAGFKTYAWTAGTPAPDQLAEKRIHDMVNKALAGKGLAAAEGNAPSDLVVATHLVAKEQKELNAVGYGGGLRFGGGGTARVDTLIQGTLVVDLYDAKSKQLVWRGTATDTASDKSAKNTEKEQKAIDKMFKDYPPKAK